MDLLCQAPAVLGCGRLSLRPTRSPAQSEHFHQAQILADRPYPSNRAALREERNTHSKLTVASGMTVVCTMNPSGSIQDRIDSSTSFAKSGVTR